VQLNRPREGDRAPPFTLPGPGGKPVSLAELLARGPVVLYFYPRDDTAGCTVEACAFRDAYPELRAAGAEVVGVSRDDEPSHAAFAARHGLPFPLLGDPTGEVHAAYGVGQILVLKDRVTFVIDREGTVRHVFDSKLRWRAHVDQALAAVRKLPPP
jgi:thioredoxin-dependent peroxiredoxin